MFRFTMIFLCIVILVLGVKVVFGNQQSPSFVEERIDVESLEQFQPLNPEGIGIESGQLSYRPNPGAYPIIIAEELRMPSAPAFISYHASFKELEGNQVVLIWKRDTTGNFVMGGMMMMIGVLGILWNRTISKPHNQNVSCPSTE